MKQEILNEGKVLKVVMDDKEGNIFSEEFANDLLNIMIKSELSPAKIIEFSSDNRVYFSKGPDINSLLSLPMEQSIPLLNKVATILNKFILAIVNSKKLTLCTVNGAAFGGGINIFLATDIRLATRRAKIFENFKSYGLPSDLSTSIFLPIITGITQMQKLLFEGKFINGIEATHLGIFHECFNTNSEMKKRVLDIESMSSAEIASIKETNSLIYPKTTDIKRKLNDEKQLLLSSFEKWRLENG